MAGLCVLAGEAGVGAVQADASAAEVVVQTHCAFGLAETGFTVATARLAGSAGLEEGRKAGVAGEGGLAVGAVGRAGGAGLGGVGLGEEVGRLAGGAEVESRAGDACRRAGNAITCSDEVSVDAILASIGGALSALIGTGLAVGGVKVVRFYAYLTLGLGAGPAAGGTVSAAEETGRAGGGGVGSESVGAVGAG